MHKHDEFTNATANVWRTLSSAPRYRWLLVTGWKASESIYDSRKCETVRVWKESKRENKISDNHLSFPYDTRKHLDYAYSYCIQTMWWPHVQPTQKQLKSCSKQNAELCKGKKFLPAFVRHQVAGGVRQWDMYAKHSAVVRCPGHANWRMRQTCMGRGPEEHKAQGIQIVFGENFWVGERITVNLTSVFSFQGF